MKRSFDEIINSLKESISSYTWYVDFAKVEKNVRNIEVNLNILNYLIGKENFDEEFVLLIKKYPEVISTFPILIAVRDKKINVIDGKLITYSFQNNENTLEEYLTFVINTGLKDLFVKEKIKNLVDYVTGVEVGLDTNARKNRTGTVMEDIVESFLKKEKSIQYLRQANIEEISSKFCSKDLHQLTQVFDDGKSNKRFDFAVKTSSGYIFLIETNFYGSGGSKLNETARSYSRLSSEIDTIENISFIWITDGKGWKTAKNNLHESYGNIEHLYSLYDLENGVFDKIFK